MPEKTNEYIISVLTQQNYINDRLAQFAAVTNESLKIMQKNIKRQKGFNNCMVLFSILCSAYIYYNEKRVDDLRKEVKELKQTKGE